MRTVNDVMGARARRVRPSLSDDEGAYVVEAALMIPALLLIALLLTWAISLGVTGIGLGETARNAARAIARGEDPQVVLEKAEAERPEAEVTMRDMGGDVMVQLIQDVRVPLLGFTGFGLTLDQSAISLREASEGLA